LSRIEEAAQALKAAEAACMMANDETAAKRLTEATERAGGALLVATILKREQAAR
jgi:uncharacterized protein HemY